MGNGLRELTYQDARELWEQAEFDGSVTRSITHIMAHGLVPKGWLLVLLPEWFMYVNQAGEYGLMPIVEGERRVAGMALKSDLGMVDGVWFIQFCNVSKVRVLGILTLHDWLDHVRTQGACNVSLKQKKEE